MVYMNTYQVYINHFLLQIFGHVNYGPPYYSPPVIFTVLMLLPVVTDVASTEDVASGVTRLELSAVGWSSTAVYLRKLLK